MLTVDIALVVHPIDTKRFPSVPPGFRWAVMVGEPRGPDPRLPSHIDLSRCPNAGWCPTIREALLEGEQNASTVLKAFRILGVPTAAHKDVLDYDPIPPGGDAIERVQ